MKNRKRIIEIATNPKMALYNKVGDVVIFNKDITLEARIYIWRHIRNTIWNTPASRLQSKDFKKGD